jgi:uncharacterized tellurite resistance protein B-like protein
MSIWKRLGFVQQDNPDGNGETATVRKIVGELEALPGDEARYVAAFAYVLSRVAYADLDISDDETVMMEHLVQEYGGLSEAQAVLVVEIAKSQAEMFGGTENFLVTREFKGLATREQREQMLHCLFAVAAADDSISGVEEEQVRRIAKELGFTDREYVDVRSAYNDKREVVKMMRAQQRSS